MQYIKIEINKLTPIQSIASPNDFTKKEDINAKTIDNKVYSNGIKKVD